MKNRPLFMKSIAALVLTMLASMSGMAHGQAASNFPSKMVRLVVAYPPGGTTDAQARIVAQKLSERWGQQVMVDNKPGGNTVIATAFTAKAPADGHTLLMTAMPFALNPLMMEKLPYDSKKDLAPVALLTTVPGVFIVHPDLGVKNVNAFIEKAKSNPAVPMPFASAGIATFTHLAGELFADMANIKFQHIPYKGSAAAHQDLISGRVQVMFDNGALQQIESGRVTPLGVTSARRLPWLPDVPTIAEQGFPDYQAAAWFGIFATGGTPPGIVAQLSQDITWAIRSPDVVKRLEAIGVFAEGGTPAEFQTYLDAETRRWSRLIKMRGIKLE